MGCELLTLGFSALPVIRAFRNQHESLRDLASLNGSSPFEHQLNCTATALGRSPAEVQRLVMLWMFDKPCKWIRLFRRRPLLNEIESYRTQGGKTALVSDYPATTKLAALGAQDLFDTVVASGEPNGPPRLKPDPAGYLAAAQRLGIPPEHCLVIGDRPDADGAAAQAAGMAFRRIV